MFRTYFYILRKLFIWICEKCEVSTLQPGPCPPTKPTPTRTPQPTLHLTACNGWNVNGQTGYNFSFGVKAAYQQEADLYYRGRMVGEFLPDVGLVPAADATEIEGIRIQQQARFN